MLQQIEILSSDSIENELDFLDYEFDTGSSSDAISLAVPEIEDLYQNFIEEIKEIIKDNIRLFFADKKYYIGGPIPEHYFTSEKYIDIVSFTSISEAALTVHAHFIGRKPKFKTKILDFPTELIISVINECHILGIKPPFCPGIILMYLEICEGEKIKYD